MVGPPNAFRYSNIAGRRLKSTDYRCRNPVGGAMPEEKYDEEYVINKLAEQEDLNLKNGQLFADQSKCSKIITERKNNDSENKVGTIKNKRNNHKQKEHWRTKTT